MRLLLDEMLPATIAEELRARGHDVWAEAEPSDLRGIADHDLGRTPFIGPPAVRVAVVVG